jgi:hypothetical protein
MKDEKEKRRNEEEEKKKQGMFHLLFFSSFLLYAMLSGGGELSVLILGCKFLGGSRGPCTWGWRRDVHYLPTFNGTHSGIMGGFSAFSESVYLSYFVRVFTTKARHEFRYCCLTVTLFY